MLILGARFISTLWPYLPVPSHADRTGPSWVSRYIVISFGVMLVVGGLTVSRDYGVSFAVLAFIVTLFGLAGFRIVSNIRKGGHGGEE